MSSQLSEIIQTYNFGVHQSLMTVQIFLFLFLMAAPPLISLFIVLRRNLVLNTSAQPIIQLKKNPRAKQKNLKLSA